MSVINPRGLLALTWLEIKIFVREPLGVFGSVFVPVFMFVIISRTGYRQVPASQAMTVILGTTVICSTLLALVIGAGAGLAFPLQNPSILPLLLFTGLFAAAIPSILFLTGIRLVGGTRAGILMLFEPVVGVALAAWLLNERLAPIQVLGGVAILAAALILQRSAAPGGRTVAAPAIEAD